MKKIIVALVLILILQNTKAQTVNIGSDTLQWLQTNIGQRTAYFSGKSFKTILDSLYQLKAQIVEFNPPILNIEQACAGTEVNGLGSINPAVSLTNHYVDNLTMYFAPITDGGTVWQIHRNLLDSNYEHNQNNTINTHVKYFKVVFQQPVAYPRQIADSDNGTWLWTPFAEYFWGPHLIQSVSVGEY
jgi:hypothetical protein